MSDTCQTTGPDLKAAGIAEESLREGSMLVGHVQGENVLLARVGAEVFAIDATCTHYGGPLGNGLLVEDTVRCPWHHACFSLRTGEALAAPAFAPLSCWHIDRDRGRIFVREKSTISPTGPPRARKENRCTGGRIVIIGGGGAGFAAAEELRREGCAAQITLISADESAPYDRPNLSKDYLAGNAPEEWIPLRPASFYADNGIDLRLATRAVGIDLRTHRILLQPGGSVDFHQLLIATGAEPRRLSIPGADLPHVLTLRSLADCRRIIDHAAWGSQAVIVGASFIGLEAAAALRRRGVAVHVVAPEERPMERVLGPAMGPFLRALHESHGVTFHLGHTLTEITAKTVHLDNGQRLPVSLILVGIGVRPRLALAEEAGLAVDGGVIVDEYLQTSVPEVYAAGDIARWPDPHSGERLRIEHWVLAERQGQTAARNMLGRRERFSRVPFFWTQHYDVSIDYVGHAAEWDAIEQSGDLIARDAALRYRKNGRTLAIATVSRDLESLRAERAMEQGRPP